MGSFSFTRAEHTTKRANIAYQDNYKILVPKEFGGGYIKDQYFDYGLVFHYKDKPHIWVDAKGEKHTFEHGTEADLYGILAYWNHCEKMDYKGEKYPSTMEEIIKNGNTVKQENRCEGIDLGCGSIKAVNNIKYPLKLVSASYKGTYEDCKGRSYGDLSQGCENITWNCSHYNYDKILEALIKAEIPFIEGVSDRLKDNETELITDLFKSAGYSFVKNPNGGYDICDIYDGTKVSEGIDNVADAMKAIESDINDLIGMIAKDFMANKGFDLQNYISRHETEIAQINLCTDLDRVCQKVDINELAESLKEPDRSKEKE